MEIDFKSMDKVEELKKIEAASFTLFTETKSWLWQLFDMEGHVVDIFLSTKRRKYNQQPFAFVHFSSQLEARKAMEKLDKTMIRCYTITVIEAKYRRFNNGKDGGNNMKNKQWVQKHVVTNMQLTNGRFLRRFSHRI